MSVSIDRELDELAEGILALLDEELGDENDALTTTEIRTQLGLEDDPSGQDKVGYRVREKLEPEDLVDSFVPDSEPGKWPAKHISLTDRGQEYVDTHDLSQAGVGVDDERLAALEERIETLEAENEQLREQVESGGATDETGGGVDTAELEQRIADNYDDLHDKLRKVANIARPNESQIEDLEDRLDGIEQTVTTIDSHPLLQDDQGINNVNRALVMSFALQVVLDNQTGITKQTIQDQYDSVWDSFAKKEEIIE